MKINLAENWKVKCKKLGIDKEVEVPFGVQLNGKGKHLSLKFVKQFSLKAPKEQVKEDKKKLFFLEFEGVNTNATIVLNGQRVGEHSGGFLPFSINVTKQIKVGGNNKLVVYVNNFSEKDVLSAGTCKITEYENTIGIIRDVNLVKRDKIAFGSKEDDGFFIYQDKKTANGEQLYFICADVKAQTKNKNILSKMHVVATLSNNVGEVISSVTAGYNPVENGEGYTVAVPVKNAQLWSPDYPYLYNLKLELFKLNEKTEDYELLDTREVKRGIREFSIEDGKFFVNGKQTEIKGICHHQAYPVVGMATSKRAECREVVKLKKAGFNTIRLLYYPASKEFYEACDTFGMMVINCMPTNGAFYNTYSFKENVVKLYREFALRDRNYTSVAMWEATLFETGAKQGMTDAFVKKCLNQIKLCFPKGAAPIIVGDTLGRKNPKGIGYDIAYCMFDSKEKKYYNPKGIKAGLISRYGAEALDANQADITDELGMATQAWSYQYIANKNAYVENCVGAIVEKDIDYTFAKGAKHSMSGIMTEYRLPKTSYYYYASQEENAARKMVYMPELTAEDAKNGVPVFSNCDYIKVYVDGSLVGKYEREIGAYTKFENEGKPKKGERKYTEFIASKLYDGSNSDKLKFAPIMVEGVDLSSGEVVVEGYQDDKVVAIQMLNSSLDANSLQINVDYSGFALQNDGRDFVFVYVLVLDEKGDIVNVDDINVELTASGASVISESTKPTKAGVCAFMIKAEKGAEQIELSATCNKALEKATTKVLIKA